MRLVNTGPGVITLQLTDGSCAYVRPGFWVDVDQDGGGHFIAVLARGCRVLP